MKYMVEVNAKWLVSVEAETALGAEHKVLELEGIWGALAFDRKAMKTDTFTGAVMTCETVSLQELTIMANEAADSVKAAANANRISRAADADVENLTKLLEEAKRKALDAKRVKGDAEHQMRQAFEKLGQQRN